MHYSPTSKLGYLSFKTRHTHLLTLAKDVKLGKYTAPIGNRTPGRRVAVHYATTAPRKLFHNDSMTFLNPLPIKILIYSSKSYRASYALKWSCPKKISSPLNQALQITCV